MRVSVSWLREWCSFDHDGRTIGAVLTERGLTVDAIEEVGNDVIIEIDVPANRPDCLGHLGVARELAAAFSLPLLQPDYRQPGAGNGPAVKIEAGDLCPVYTAAIVRGISNGPSPDWLRKRLESVGLRSIDCIVDISNYVMMHLGQPVHFFDADTISGGCIRIRRATSGEKLTTLDGVDRTLDESMLVIADSERAIALAGVIGGAATQIAAESRNVLIEAAHFTPSSIRRTARKLGLPTDASHRFERGVDPALPAAAQELARKLLVELASARSDEDWSIAGAEATAPRTLTLRPARVERLLGYAPSGKEINASLAALQLHPEGNDPVTIRVPSWRFDLDCEADLVEEVGRHLGFDRIPGGLPTGIDAATAVSDPVWTEANIEERARDLLASAGLLECCNYSMLAPGQDRDFVTPDTPAALTLTHPLAEGWSELRRSLLPGLIAAADTNVRRGAEDLRLFEVGHSFLANIGGELPEEPLRVAILLSGRRTPEHWSREDSEFGGADLRGLVENLIQGLDPNYPLSWSAGELPGMTPGRTAQALDSDGLLLARSGPLHPAIAKQYHFTRSVWLAEVDLSRFTGRAQTPIRYRNISKFPQVQRDISLQLDSGVRYDELMKSLDNVDAPAAVRFTAPDRFVGGKLATGRSALLLRFILSPADRTLTDEETEGYRASLIAAAESNPGVRLRE
jgi:phenylalanyl-tRNA synthetase beta chain